MLGAELFGRCDKVTVTKRRGPVPQRERLVEMSKLPTHHVFCHLLRKSGREITQIARHRDIAPIATVGRGVAAALVNCFDSLA